jgi:hypothetical protein
VRMQSMRELAWDEDSMSSGGIIYSDFAPLQHIFSKS